MGHQFKTPLTKIIAFRVVSMFTIHALIIRLHFAPYLGRPNQAGDFTACRYIRNDSQKSPFLKQAPPALLTVQSPCFCRTMLRTSRGPAGSADPLRADRGGGRCRHPWAEGRRADHCRSRLQGWPPCSPPAPPGRGPGADPFWSFFPGADPMAVVGLARAITGSLAAGFDIDGVRLACACHSGIALSPSDGATAAALLAQCRTGPCGRP